MVGQWLGLSATTLRRWREERDTGRVGPELRGRRPFLPTRPLLRALLDCVEELFVTGVRAIHRALPEFTRPAIEWAVARVRERRERRSYRAELIWTTVGAVWTMDHTELDEAIDGEFSFLLVVRDLASGRVLSALPTRSTDHGPVVEELERLFRIYGAPLVLKSDNGSGLVGESVGDLLARWGVTALRSPPRTPTYNGAVEAGMGSLKARVAEIARQQGRAGAPTRDDLDAAVTLQRALGRPRTAALSPDEAWQRRTPVPEDERARFLAALAEARESLLRDGVPASILERTAVRNVLTAMHYLEIRRT
jgi:transposase InsO family protein